MFDSNTAATIAIAGIGAASTVAGYVIRSYVNGQVAKVDTRLEVHESEDRIIHTHVKETLDRMETKLDKVLEQRKQ